MIRVKQTRYLVISLFLAILFPFSVYAAPQYTSPNYGADQTFFGTGGELNACSSGGTGYCAKQTVGELGSGNYSSPNYQIQAGFNTTDDPFLEFVVTGANIDLGNLSTGSTATANGAFSVRAWQSGGYAVQTGSDPPSYSTHSLAPMTSGGASVAGTEQFGINLVRNQTTCPTPAPANFGADPSQVPDSTFSFGTAAAGYNTCGVFKYNKGDTVAQSTKSTSITAYTVSYIFNISSTTPAGQYTFSHTLVATATY